jgi:hypothetical protein
VSVDGSTRRSRDCREKPGYGVTELSIIRFGIVY